MYPFSITFVFEGELPDLNQFIEANRKSPFIGSKMKKDATDYVTLWAMRQAGHGFKTIDFPVFVEFHWHCKNKRKDKDNISSMGRKVILDGLQKAGIIAQDNWNAIIGFSDTFHIDAYMPRVEAIIKY